MLSCGPSLFRSPRPVVVIAGGDSLWASVVNSTTFNGTNGGTTFPNLATVNAGAAFAAAGTAALSNVITRFGATTSLLVTGTVNYARTIADANYIIGTGDYTIEFGGYITSNPGAPYVFRLGSGVPSTGQSQMFMFAPSGGLEWIDWQTAGTTTLSTGAYTVSQNAWHDFAYTRTGTTGRFFVDGVVQQSGANNANITGNALLQLGSDSTAGTLSMYVANFRFTRACRYTANYTPAIAPFPTS